MKNLSFPERPSINNWNIWQERWDKMQDKFVLQRSERFEIIADLVVATQPRNPKVLDIGCGTGSLSQVILKKSPTAILYCVDVDPTLLWIAEELKENNKDRVYISQADLRDNSWVKDYSFKFDAIVSATALHWLTANELQSLYLNIYSMLTENGLFINADHAGSESTLLQAYWEKSRESQREVEEEKEINDWDSFWIDYSKGINIDIKAIHDELFNNRETGSEEGQSLSWHMEKLKAAGFSMTECFKRFDCDAIYGGFR
jgi:SAM-dependent methyltransferase